MSFDNFWERATRDPSHVAVIEPDAHQVSAGELLASANQLVQYANTLIKNKVLFGSDHPMITTDRWLADFQTAGFREEVQPLILKENAAKLLGLRP